MCIRDRLKEYGTPSDGPSSDTLNQLAAKAVTSTDAVDGAVAKAKVSWQAPDGVTVDSVSYNGSTVTAVSYTHLALPTG